MYMKADRDLELNYEGTLIVLKGQEQAVHRVCGTGDGKLKVKDVLTNSTQIVNINDDMVSVELPPSGVRDIGGEAYLIGRRVTRQYRRCSNLNNVEWLRIRDGHSAKPHNVVDGILYRELFAPTYPDLDYAMWSMKSGRVQSAALNCDLSAVKQGNGLVLYYRQWCIGGINPDTMEPILEHKEPILESIVSSYFWGVE